jgi:hypothetical protein
MFSTAKQFEFTMQLMEHSSYTRLMEVLKSIGAISNAADLARLLNISEQNVTNWKKRGIAKDTLIELSDRFGFRIKYVTDRDGEMFHQPVYKINSPEQKMHMVMQNLDEATKYKAVRLVNSLAEPNEDNNGNHHTQ